MDIKQLEAFAATVRHKSFSKAAKELFLSQPTVSSHVQSLEKELHTRLILRSTKEFTITEDGLRLYEYACSILDLQEKALQELAHDEPTTLRLGASTVPGLYVIPEILAAYHACAPDLNFHCNSSDSKNIISQVIEGKLDVGFVGTFVPKTPCAFFPIADDELVIATPNTPHFQDLKRQKNPLSELLKEPFIVREDDSGTKIEALHFFEQLSIPTSDIKVVASMNQPEVIRQCVIQGLGISIMSRKTIEYSYEQGQLLFFTMGNRPLLRKLYMVYMKNGYLSPTVKNFITFMESYQLKEFPIFPANQ